MPEIDLQLSCSESQFFDEAKDPILPGGEGDLWKFKPGISANFISRYVQISGRAFRYFKNRGSKYGKPLVVFPKRIIESVKPLYVNKNSYIKPGSAIAKTHKEDKLFDNMFEIVLRADYEDFTHERDYERQMIDR